MAYENFAWKYINMLELQLLLTQEDIADPDGESTSISLLCKYYILLVRTYI